MHILFVCTGNICRSPLAEGIARHHHADLATYSSAGTRAIRDSPPTRPAIAVAREEGVDITGLRGTALDAAVAVTADRVYVMTERHHAHILRAYPELTERVQLLDPRGDIADPYGADIEVYRRVRDQIREAVAARAREWSQVAP